MRVAKLIFVGWLTFVSASCGGPGARTAPFRARPDSVEPGSLLGPFTGRVVDENGRPIPGALVYSTWSFREGYGLTSPAGFREHVTSTDSDGRYVVPKVGDAPNGRSTRLTDFYLVIYKRGYVAYRSDRRFDDLGPRLDFAQKRHEVVLARWRSDQSHAKHLRYIGGGSALASLTAWESDDAAAEMAGVNLNEPQLTTDPFAPGQTSVRDAVVATRLLQPDDVKRITGFEGAFETGPLRDEPDTQSYSSVHLKALDLPETYDVALRLWKLAPGAAQRQYGQLLDSLPGAKEDNQIADRSLRAVEGNIRGVAFLDGKRFAVVLITCGASLCKDDAQALEIGRTAYERLQNIWPMGGSQ